MTQPLDPQTRIGDRERAEAQRMLTEHMEAGRLTPEEYTERAAVAQTAKVVADLLPLFADLPGHHRDPVPVSFTPAQPPSQKRADMSGLVLSLAVCGGVFVTGCAGSVALAVFGVLPSYRAIQLIAVIGVFCSMLFVALGLARILRPGPSRPYDQQGG